MSWQINIPYRDRDESLDPLSIHETTATIGDKRQREVTRQLLRDLYLDGTCSTYGDVISTIERANSSARRAMLDSARRRAGLEPTGEVDKAKALAQVLRDDPPEPPRGGPQRNANGAAVQECAADGCDVISTGDGRVRPVKARRWWCDGHKGEAAAGDLDDWQEPGVRVNPRTGAPMLTSEAEQHYRQHAERAKAKREAKDRKDRERRAEDAERLEKLEAEHRASLTMPAALRGGR